MHNTSDAAVYSIWQEQSREKRPMRPEDIRTKAERLDARARRWRVFTAALFIVLIVVEALQVWRDDALLERAGDSLTIAALIYVAYRFRRQRLAAAPAALGDTSSVAFYRAELARQRDLSTDSRGYLLPFVPGVALALFGRGLGARSPGETIAIIAVGVALFMGAAAWNAYTARALQREIDALDA